MSIEYQLLHPDSLSNKIARGEVELPILSIADLDRFIEEQLGRKLPTKDYDISEIEKRMEDEEGD